MPSEINQHNARVQRFCLDLGDLKPNEVIRKYITTGMPYDGPQKLDQEIR
jgi:hypothetical protein